MEWGLPGLSLLLSTTLTARRHVPRRGGIPGAGRPPSPLCRVPGPQLTWGTRKARHPAPSRETPEVRDGTPSPTTPQFTMFVLSRLKKLKQGADTWGPAHLGPDAFPEPTPPALLTHVHTQPHSIALAHTRVSTQARKPTPPHTHIHTIFAFIPTLFHTHTSPHDPILFTH